MLIRNVHLLETYQSEEELSSKLFNLRGMVISTKMNKTIVIRRNYLHYVKKYKIIKIIF